MSQSHQQLDSQQQVNIDVQSTMAYLSSNSWRHLEKNLNMSMTPIGNENNVNYSKSTFQSS
jgi:hypothetical protein